MDFLGAKGGPHNFLMLPAAVNVEKYETGANHFSFLSHLLILFKDDELSTWSQQRTSFWWELW